MVPQVFQKMKILVIMKRFGANKDMVMQDFGRQIRLFEPLAKKHKIDFFCPDYTKKESKIINRKNIRFIITPITIFSTYKFMHSLKRLIKKEKYGIIIATTDPLIGILSYFYSKKFKIPLVYDLQDNFEIYDTYKLPFISYLDKKAVKNADVVLTVSQSLKDYISRFRKKTTYVIQNGIELNPFKKTSKNSARKKLNLPLKSKIIIYVGEISKYKGADIMLQAFEKVRKQTHDTYLLLSGKILNNINIKKPNIIFEELPKREEVVMALNASDIALIPNIENPFSKYCFPYKVLEYMAADLPIVATSIGDVKMLLSRQKNSLCMPGNADDMADKIIANLKAKKKISYKNYLNQFSWENLAGKVDSTITDITKK